MRRRRRRRRGLGVFINGIMTRCIVGCCLGLDCG